MDDFPGLLARDFGFRPQGKAAPMSASRGVGVGPGPTNAAIGSRGPTRSGGWSSTPPGGSLFGEHDGLFGPGGAKNQNTPQDYGGFDDIFGGPTRAAPPSSSSSALPVYDKPVYDDDIFDGVPGVKSTGSVKYDDVFSSISKGPTYADHYDDLLGGFGRSDPEPKGSSGKRSGDREQEAPGFDDLIPGFGGSSPPQKRETSETNRHPQSTVPSTKSTSSVSEDPFVVLESASVPAYSSSGLFADPLEHINKPSNTDSTKADGSAGGAAFDNIDAFDGLAINSSRKDKSPLRSGLNLSPSHATARKEATEKPSAKNFESIAQKKVPVDDYRESHQTLFDMPAASSDSYRSVGRSGSRPKDINTNSYEASSQVDMSPKSDENVETADDVWLTVSEIPLFTQPTNAPPPSRPPPPLITKPSQASKADRGSAAGVNVKRKVTGTDSVKISGIPSIDELEDFAMGRPQNFADERADAVSSEEEIEPNSAAAVSAAAMKEAMDRAEARFKHAREVRERERDAKSVRSREPARQEGDEKSMQDAQEREYKEKQERFDREREQKEMEEKEREQKRVERERERERERIEREKARQAVERATREARDRAATEARARAERAAVEKANAEARERAERAAVQRAAAEARERAAAEARERAEKAASEARERAAAEARQRAVAEARDKAATEARERAAVERAAAEVRARAERAAVERANAEARERAAAVARERQQKNENDLESFFGMGSRPSSVPRQRSATPDSAFDTQFQSKGGSEAARRTSSATSSSIRKASSATNIVDDLTSIFGATPSSGDFQEVEGESEERRRARLERHQRTLERAAKALAEKNERDFQNQRDQAERHRIAETLDVEIKRWAAGKEGNLRALLSTLQYVLWPECGWQPVSLTDLITAASVKKVYRKATLCIHPDKVQQKGANLQQKYIAEKVFDLLKEAWNKLNSEELF
ncbi:auxilin-related protein 2-like [Magnolia sinica]|uniref:auxilin-related protein 2-like n=1 Tax=Magnolia sinica TaxID=86752 RepID=UPI0026591C91|nr:auxilin-related protein 2-like [Magnolia sinica]